MSGPCPITVGQPLANGAVPLAYSIRVTDRQEVCGHVLALAVSRSVHPFAVWSWFPRDGVASCFWGEYFTDLSDALLYFTEKSKRKQERIVNAHDIVDGIIANDMATAFDQETNDA